jgi:hypothetical protein
LGSDGTLDLAARRKVRRYGVEEYRQASEARKSAQARDATVLFENANRWKAEGEQGKALSALSQLAKTSALDEATNEDARVQLRELQTQQAVVGLNTRRQRFYLDNRGDDPGFARNEMLEQAADRNPLLQGELNYDPQEVEGLLGGNTQEENSSLQRIAARLVSQQLAAEPAPQAIDITLPRHGEIASFRRSIQVDGGSPLELELRVGRESGTGAWFALLVVAALGVLAWLALSPGRAVRAEG